MFKKSKEYNEILNELNINKILNEKAHFQCFVDGIIEYQLTHNNIKHVFKIVADDNFINIMPIEWILNLNRVTYFSHEIYLRSIDSWSCEGCKTYQSMITNLN